jgi:hypothetical protein
VGGFGKKVSLRTTSQLRWDVVSWDVVKNGLETHVVTKQPSEHHYLSHETFQFPRDLWLLSKRLFKSNGPQPHHFFGSPADF